jgi:hypothetical protein
MTGHCNCHVKRGNSRKRGIHEYRSQPPQIAPGERRRDPEKKKNIILLICDPFF